MKHRTMVVLFMASFLVATGCKDNIPNIDSFKGDWISDHRCVEEVDYNISKKTTISTYESFIISLDDSAFWDSEARTPVNVKYMCKS